ncbi:hypothetical protein [Streptomyces sp. NPDC097640]|uniref:hypothetical protein n=1 Tax=Streptomyces sp. NPDC097640 TaxID=3157229 RepID=UPI0033315127
MFLPFVLHLQTTLGLTPTQAGLLTAPMALVAATMGPFIGRLSDRVNAKLRCCPACWAWSSAWRLSQP